MKKLFIAFLLAGSVFFIANAQVYFEWADQMGGPVIEQGSSIITDGAGNVYTTGFFGNTADFDPAAGTSALSTFGSTDAYVSKFDSEGNFLWAKQLGGNAGDAGVSVAVSPGGSVFTTGNFQGTADLNPSSGTANFTSTTGTDVYISKLDTGGNFVWAKHIEADGVTSVALDSDSNIYVLGFFSGTVDFNPDAGVFNLSAAGDQDIFLLKLNDAGNFIWAVSFGGTLSDEGSSLTTDKADYVFVTGSFRDAVDFNPGTAAFNLTSTGGKDAFIVKLDTGSAFVWAKQFGGTDDDYASSIAVDTSGNVYTIGIFTGTVDFNPNAGMFNMTTSGGNDMFISKLDATGNFVWAKQSDAWTSDIDHALAVDENESVYLTGYFLGIVDFDPGSATFNLTSAGSNDIFLQKINAGGSLEWAYQFGEANDDRGMAVAVDAEKNVLTTGYFDGMVDFDPDTAVFHLTDVGIVDIFVLKMSQCRASEVPDIAASKDTICAGEMVTLSITAGKLNSADDWHWYSETCGGNMAGTGTSVSVTPSATALYFARGEGACFLPESCQNLTILVNPLPMPELESDTTVCDTISLTLDAGIASAYLWNTSETAQTIVASGSGNTLKTYWVEITDDNGCVGADTIEITFTTCVGIRENAFSAAINVFPNPASRELHIAFDKKATIEASLFNALGEEVVFSSSKNSPLTMDIASLPRGMYLLYLKGNEYGAIRKVIIE